MKCTDKSHDRRSTYDQSKSHTDRPGRLRQFFNTYSEGDIETEGAWLIKETLQLKARAILDILEKRYHGNQHRPPAVLVSPAL
eukprot:CAMPEP_0119103870 /NCGR_PEP_ID=MMETSP1180-20130426/2224_1 /TAXON_ID=3052 ORGANISM="Chlamydomonas cf sp, Strain CCMP681" /NCGR_SAMPLE_ID=MMETSP1180 /ASSEMBLY_ACC=CAM_ASM_000741 /LENGTH=82 /DNA_ID=CAMNT_0007088477 /DNA_START=159 /DNA_END=404 /DNA_ORIENTATION=-